MNNFETSAGASVLVLHDSHIARALGLVVTHYGMCVLYYTGWVLLGEVHADLVMDDGGGVGAYINDAIWRHML